MKHMKLPEPEVDLKEFRLSKIGQKDYRHFLLLLIWPVYYLRYFIVEAMNANAAQCYVMYSPLDDLIPLCEYFLVPYGLWMVCMLGMHIFTMLYDVKTFKRYTAYLVLSFTISTTVFILFPTCQNLRPESFERDNLFTWILGMVYEFDTNTNVCPSEHVIGSMAVLAAAVNCRYFRKPMRITIISILMVVISLSTVFLKQHSILDVFFALPVCFLCYMICFPVFRKEVSPENRVLTGTV